MYLVIKNVHDQQCCLSLCLKKFRKKKDSSGEPQQLKNILGKISDGFVKVSNIIVNVSDGIGKRSYGLRKVSYGIE